jgi:hypothetical protein
VQHRHYAIREAPETGGHRGFGFRKGGTVMGGTPHHLDFALLLLCPLSNTSAGAILTPRFSICLGGEVRARWAVRFARDDYGGTSNDKESLGRSPGLSFSPQEWSIDG